MLFLHKILISLQILLFSRFYQYYTIFKLTNDNIVYFWEGHWFSWKVEQNCLKITGSHLVSAVPQNYHVYLIMLDKQDSIFIYWLLDVTEARLDDMCWFLNLSTADTVRVVRLVQDPLRRHSIMWNTSVSAGASVCVCVDAWRHRTMISSGASERRVCVSLRLTSLCLLWCSVAFK